MRTGKGVRAIAARVLRGEDFPIRFSLEMEGERVLICHGVRRVPEASATLCAFRTLSGRVMTVEGCGLVCTGFCDGAVEVRGTIDAIRFDGGRS